MNKELGYLLLTTFRVMVLFCTTILLISCGNDGNNKGYLAGNPLAENMAGNWHTQELHIEVSSYNGDGSDTVFHIPYDYFPAMLGIVDNKGKYELDGTFEESYYGPNDSLMMSVSGNWDVKDDTVYVQQMVPSYNENRYTLELKGDTGIFRGYVDWDRDGYYDDLFTGKALKMM